MIWLWTYLVINFLILFVATYKGAIVDVSDTKKQIALLIIIILLFGFPIAIWLIVDDVFIDRTKKH